MANMITLIILAPLAGALVVGSLPDRLARPTALSVNAVTAAIVALIWRSFDQSATGLQLVERYAWIPAIGAEYVAALDGFSLLLLVLTSIVFPFAFAAERRGRGFFSLMLITQSALYGTFVAQNLILWFLFFEMSLVPGFLLIKVFGGENREYAATKFFVYTFVGSVAMLLAFLAIYFVRGTFDFEQLAAFGKTGWIAGSLTWLAFAGIFFGLAVKVPLFPFHTWLPDAYQAAPTGAAMVLTGVLSKMGVYGFVRLMLPLFPTQLRILRPWLLSLALCSIIFASLAAWAQRDLKRMVGYLSINHLGYCMLGLFALNANSGTRVNGEDQMALSGVFMQVFNHGITAAALFYFVGLLEDRRSARCLEDFGGLMQRTPLLCGWMAVAMFSSLGLPGLNGFIGEFLIFRGSFAPGITYVAIAVSGLLITAIVLLRAMQALFSGPLAETCSAFPDLLWSEKLVVVPVTLLMFAIGIAPQFLFDIFNATVVHLARSFA